MGSYVTLDGQGHFLWNYTGGHAIWDNGTGTTVRNVYIYYPKTGIWVNQEGKANGAKNIYNIGVYGAREDGVQFSGVHSTQGGYPQPTYVRDAWSLSGWGVGFKVSGDPLLGEAGNVLTNFERVAAHYHSYNGLNGAGLESRYSNTKVYSSEFSENEKCGILFYGNFKGTIQNTRVNNNGNWGFYTANNRNFYTFQNYGRGNGEIDCQGIGDGEDTNGGAYNDFGTYQGPACAYWPRAK